MNVSEALTRFINVLGATVVGVLVMGVLMFFIAKGLGLRGGGILYTVIFLAAAAASYPSVRRLTAAHPFMKILTGLLGLAVIIVFVASWRALGAEDPGVPLIIVAVFLGLGFWATRFKKNKG